MNQIIQLSPSADLVAVARVLAAHVAYVHGSSEGQFFAADCARDVLLHGAELGEVVNMDGDELLAELLAVVRNVREKKRKGGAA